MADNYIENRMEEHRRRRAAPPSSFKQAHRPRPGRVEVAYNPGRVLVGGGDTPVGRALIDAFRRMQCRVAFTITPQASAATGNEIAQRTGAQYHPGTLPEAVERLEAASDPPGVIIGPDSDDGVTKAAALPVMCGQVSLKMTVGTCCFPIDPRPLALGPEAVARWCLFAAVNPDIFATLEDF